MELAREFSLKEGTDFMQESRDKIRTSFKLEPVSVVAVRLGSWGQMGEQAVYSRGFPGQMETLRKDRCHQAKAFKLGR